MATFGSAGSINYSDKKALSEGHSMRSTCGSTRHSSLGDHKSLEAEALAEVRALRKAGWASGDPQSGCRVGTCGLGGHFALNARLKAKPEHKIDRELASHLPAGLPMGMEVGWVLLLARVPVKTEDHPPFSLQEWRGNSCLRERLEAGDVGLAGDSMRWHN